MINQLFALFIGERGRVAVPETMIRSIDEHTQLFSEQLERAVSGGLFLILLGLKGIVHKLPQNEFATESSVLDGGLSNLLLKFSHAACTSGRLNSLGPQV